MMRTQAGCWQRARRRPTSGESEGQQHDDPSAQS